MFTNKYRPKTIDQFIGNKPIIQSFIQWLSNWTEHSKLKGALISGACGIGKDVLVDLVLNMQHFHFNIVYADLDDERNAEFVKTVIKPLIKSKLSFNGKHNLLVINHIDSGCDHGLISHLNYLLKETIIPIICICDNRYDQSIRPILGLCQDFTLVKPSYNEVSTFLYSVAAKEGIRMNPSTIQSMVEESNGDIRFLLNSLQFRSKTDFKNIQSTNLFETTSRLLSMDETMDSKYDLYWLANDMHPFMIQENYINNQLISRDERQKWQNMSQTADAISDMDLFDPVLGLEPYIALSMIRATSFCNKKSMIQFPQILGRISTMNKNKREKWNYENASFLEKEDKEKEKELKKLEKEKEKDLKRLEKEKEKDLKRLEKEKEKDLKRLEKEKEINLKRLKKEKEKELKRLEKEKEKELKKKTKIN